MNPEDFENKIIQGDTLTELKKMPDDFVDCIITSPPYWSLRTYLPKDHPDKPKEIGLEPTFKEYLDKLVEIFKEAKRVLKPTGSMWINMGDSYASQGKIGGDFGESGKWSKLTNPDLIAVMGRSRTNEYPEKSLIGQPWRLAIRLCDELELILRADIVWAKQVIMRDKEKGYYTKGSAMPSSVKDRVNMTHEHLFHFVKQKSYYYDIDAVRIPCFEPNIERPRMGENQSHSFNYRVRDSKKKKDQAPQFKASEEEIKNYKMAQIGGQTTQGITRERMKRKGRGSNNPALNNRNFMPIKNNKVGDPRGNHEGGPGSWRDFKDENESFTNPAGKNIPSVHLIEEERDNFIPFSLEKQITILGVEEFENLKNIFGIIENQLIDSSTGMQFGTDISTNNNSQNVSNTIQEFFSARKIQPYLTLFRGSPYTTIAIKNSPNEISIIFGRNVWIFRNETFAGDNTSFSEREYKWFAINSNAVIGQILPLFNWISGLQLGTDYIQQLNIFRKKSELSFSNISISDKQAQEISGGVSNFAKVFLVESIFFLIGEIISNAVSLKTMIMFDTKSSTNSSSSAILNRTDKILSNKLSEFIPHILNISEYFEKGNTLPSVWLIGSEPSKELHFAKFPTALVEIPIKATCPEKICKKCGFIVEKIIKNEYVGSSVKRGGHIVGDGEKSQGSVYNIPKKSADKEFFGFTKCLCENPEYESGIVMDIFAGTSTTAVVAKKLRRRFIMIELNETYIKMGKEKLRQEVLNL